MNIKDLTVDLDTYIIKDNNLSIGKKTMGLLIEGLNLATAPIRLTYGPKGINAIIEHELYPYRQIANDAQTIVQAIHTEHPIKKQGLGFAKELMDKANADSGDGRKTTFLILQSILEQAHKSNISGLELKRELDNLIPLIEEKINENKKEITEASVFKVARIAGESVELGDILGEIYNRIGRDGIIIPESSGDYRTSFSIIEGVRFTGTGFLSPYMAYDQEASKEGRKETKAIYEKPIILVTKNKITKDSDIESLLNAATDTGKPLVIFTDDMDSGVASRMIATHRAKVIKLLIIKAPTLWKNYVFEDFAKVVGATIVEDSSGVNFKNLKLEHLGTCDRIEVDKDETIILGGIDISDHIAELKKNEDNDSKLRLSWLTTKTAILKIGANNESEQSYLRLKCYDAINSSKLALRDGVVVGGGVCLANIATAIPKSISGDILRQALVEPYIQNRTNMGLGLIVDNIENPIFPSFGEDILDAAAVVKNAVRNAISLASTILTTGIVICLPKKSAEQIAAEALKNKGLRF